MTNVEARMTKECRSTNDECRNAVSSMLAVRRGFRTFGHYCFGYSSFFWHSDFVLRHSQLEGQR